MVLIAAALGCVVTYKGLTKIPFLREHSEIVLMVLGAIAALVLFYLLSGLVTSVLYVVLGCLVLTVALVVATANLLSVLDRGHPELREELLLRVAGSARDRPMRKLVRDNVRALESWLSTVVNLQMNSGEIRLELEGSFVEDFDHSCFEIVADPKTEPHWKNIDDRLLVPVKIILTVRQENTAEWASVLNVQMGMVVVEQYGEVRFKRFSQKGFEALGLGLSEWNAAKVQGLVEDQVRLRRNLELFDSQSVG